MSNRSRGGRGRSPQMPRQQSAEPSTPRAEATGRRSYSSGTSSRKDLEFDLDGVTFHPVGVPTLDMFELAGVAAVLDPDTPVSQMDAQSLKQIAQLWKTVFGFDLDAGREYNRFKAHTTAHSTPMPVLMSVLSDLMAGSGKDAGRPASSSAGGRSSNVLPLSGHSRRSPQRPEPTGLHDQEQVSPFTPAEQRLIAMRKAEERAELRRMGFTDADLSPPAAYGVGS